MSKYKGDSGMGCVVLLFMLALGLSLGLGFAALVTWLVSVLGLIEFTFINTLVVWALIIILGVVFNT